MAWNDVAGGAGTGAGIGGALGSIVPGIGTAIGTGIGGLLGAAAGGLFGRKKNDETKIQKTQRELVDQLLSSLNGNGPYSSLFAPNEADFQKSFVDPAKSRFRNQIAPQIQQSYIAGGQQRGTGLEGQLARAGVDMDSLLNEHYLDYLNQGKNRQANAIGQILGQGPGASGSDQSWGSAALQGLGGYISGPDFKQDIGGILDSFNKRPAPHSESIQDTFLPPKKGYEDDNPIYNPYTGVQSYGRG